MDDQNKNLLLATALSFLVILVWFILFPPQDPVPQPAPAVSTTTQGDSQAGGTVAPPAAGGATTATPTLTATAAETRTQALAKSARVKIATPRVSGSISLVGGRIDDLHLNDYNVRLNDPSQKVVLLSPAGGPDAYFSLFGWAPGGDLGFDDVPGPQTEWTLAEGTTLTPESPVTLAWTNAKGITFRNRIAIDADYMFTVTQTVENATDAAVRMFPYGIVARKGEPDTIGFYILHEGVVRYADGTLSEIDYDDMPDQPFDAAEASNIEKVSVTDNGWIGFTDKYWMTTLAPQAGTRFTSVTKYTPQNDTYQTEVRMEVMTIGAGATATATTRMFAGAKEWDAITHYEDTLNIAKFVDSIDWGWFFFLTKPIFRLLHAVNGLIGNMGWAIIVLTIIIKGILFPLAYRSYVSMARMKELQPEMEKLKEKVGDDRAKMQQEMMKLYKDKGVNPAAGCLPILLQIPIFFSLYKVIFVTIELRHAPWIWWIHDLSAADPTSWMNLFGLLPWGAPDPTGIFGLLSIGVLPVLMGITMWLQQKLNPAPTDATQAAIFAWMPWVFMFMLGSFASGLVLYWIANNTLTFTQQYAIMRSHGHKPDVFGNILSGFRKARAGAKK